MTKEEYARDLQSNLEDLVSRLKCKAYRPLPARRVYIPKADGKQRPLGISALENKIVECGIKRILESVYEADFMESSYGYRPNCPRGTEEGRQSHHAATRALYRGSGYQRLFDHVDHDKLIEMLRKRFNDGSLLFLIRRFLKAGYVDKGVLVRSDEGTPQGSILSPVLANVYLHYVLDTWFADGEASC